MAADARTAHSMEDSVGAPVSGLWEPLRAVLLAPWSLTDLHEAVPRRGSAPTPRELRPRIACGTAAPADRWHRERQTVKGYEADAVTASPHGEAALAPMPSLMSLVMGQRRLAPSVSFAFPLFPS